MEIINISFQWNRFLIELNDNHKIEFWYFHAEKILLFPIENHWEIISPEWIKKEYKMLEMEIKKWCIENNYKFEKTENYQITFDNVWHTIIPNFGKGLWMGYYNLISAKTNDNKHEIFLKYIGETPHGDSYHEIIVDGNKLDGLAWGCMFLCDEKNENLFFQWMEKFIERKVVMYNFQNKKLYIFPIFINNFYLDNEYIYGYNDNKEEIKYNYKELIKNT